MNTGNETITFSPAFSQSMNMKSSLKAGLEAAFKRGDLALYFMHSEPPTEEECLMGQQLIDPNDIEPLVKTGSLYYHSYRTYHHTYRYARRDNPSVYNGLVCAGRAVLDPTKLQMAHEFTGAQSDPSTLLNLVPIDPEGATLDLSANTRGDHTLPKVYAYQLGEPLVKWAFLAHKDYINLHENTWVLNRDYTPPPFTFSYYAEKILFDFRGAIPLTIGCIGSPANLWVTDTYQTKDVTLSSPTYAPIAGLGIKSLTLPNIA